MSESKQAKLIVNTLQLPHLKEFDNDRDHQSIKLLLQNVSFAMGFIVIFVISWFEST